MNVDNQTPDGNDHLTIQSITQWLNGESPANLQLEYQQHCIRCANCREQVAMISQSTQPDEEMVRSTEFQELLRIGEQAAMRVWKEQRQFAEATESKPEQKAEQPKQEPWFRRWIRARQPAFRWAAAAALLLAIAIPGYRYWQSTQPVERSMASLRQAWDRNRPLEIRITGDFPYRPYLVTRGPGDTISVNKAQLLAATADLAREVAEHPSPHAKHALGRLHLLKEEFDDAEKLLKEVINEEPKNAQAHVDLASVYYEQGVRSESMQLLAKAADNLKSATEVSPKLTEAWFNLALCNEQMKLDSQAIKNWERFLELDGDSKWADEAREHLQKLRNRSQLFTPESSTVAEDLLVAEATGDEAKIQRLLTEKYSELTTIAWGRLLDWYLTEVSAGNQPESGKYLRVLQHVGELIRDNKKDHYYADQLDFITHSNAARLEQISLIRDLLARAEQRYQTGDYNRAVALFWQTLLAAKKIGDQCHSESAMYGIAKVYTPQTERANTPAIRQQLVTAAASLRHLQMQAKALGALANQYLAQQMISQSLAQSSKASEIALSIGDSDYTVYSLRNIVTAYNYAGQAEAAYKNSYLMLQLLRKYTANLRNNCASYADLAERFAVSNDYPRAIDYQVEALQFCERGDRGAYVYELSRAASYYSQNNQQDMAAELLNRAIGIARAYVSQTGMQSLLFALHLHLGEVLLRQRKSEQAEAAYSSAMSAIAQPSHGRFSAEISYGLARAYLQQRRSNEAETELAKCITLEERALANMNETGSRSGFIESRLNIYRTMVDFQYFHKQAPVQAFDYAERYRSRELLDVLSASDASMRIVNGVRAVARPLALDQVQRLMPAHAQFLAYTITDQQLLIWQITPTEWHVAGVPITPARLQTLVSDFLNKIRNLDDIQTITPLARDLYRILIEPVAIHLNQQRTLVIIPDGALHALPFAALTSPATGHHLVEDYTLSNSPSASVFVELVRLGQKKKPSVKGSLLVLSNPKFNRQFYPNLQWLPGTEQEAADLQYFYPISLQLSHERATKQALLDEMGKYEIVHLSAHSITNEHNPLYSAIVLAATEQSTSQAIAAQSILADDALQAREVFGLDLPRTRLIILSSCRSSTPEQLYRNSFGTMAQAFFSAQVPAVISSLWEVEDSSTAKLMLAFHRAYRSQGSNFSQALRQAQLSLLRADNKKWRHPYYWAAFLISGNGLMT